MYVSNAVDPRDVNFPDDTAIDLGQLESPYGMQRYSVPGAEEEVQQYRTVVLFDKSLERIYGFAQLD